MDIDPYSLGEVVEETKVAYRNAQTMYDVIAQRQAQTHTSLNSINQQLPKIAKQGTDLTITLTSLKRDLDDLQGTDPTITLESLKEGLDGVQGTNQGITLTSLKTDLDSCISGASARKLEEISSIGSDDLEGLKQEFQQEMSQLKQELKKQFEQERSQLKDEMKQEFQQEINQLKEQMTGYLERIEMLMRGLASET